MIPKAARSTVGKLRRENAERPWARKGGGDGWLGIERIKSSVALHGRRSDEPRARNSVRDIRNADGSESRTKATDAEAKNRIRMGNRIMCDVEHHGADD